MLPVLPEVATSQARRTTPLRNQSHHNLTFMPWAHNFFSSGLIQQFLAQQLVGQHPFEARVFLLQLLELLA